MMSLFKKKSIKVTGHGVPQLTAVHEVWRAIHDFGTKTGYYVPVIADGGIRNSGMSVQPPIS